MTTVPPVFLSSSGQEAAELAAIAGLRLDPWQQLVLDQGLRERGDGKWAAFECVVNVPRQNGKGGIIEARELAGLFLLGEKLILHSAHEFKTSIEAFRRIESLIVNCDQLRKRVARVRRTTGEEAIELIGGQRLRFLARSGGSGRGFTGDCNILDEAMILGDEAMGALMPTMAAVPNPQIWYLGSAGIGSPSAQLGRLRRRALAAAESGEPDPSLAYFEWSISPHADECRPDCTDHDDIDDPRSHARANPALGIRITPEHVRNELLSMGELVFARERLGHGAYPSDAADTWSVVGEDAWRALADGSSRPADPVVFAIDATPERSHAAICVAGQSGEVVHVEVVDHRPGTGWVVARAKELHEKWQPAAWVVDAGGPAGSLIADLERELDMEVTAPKTREIGQATGQFIDSVTDQTTVHLDQAPLSAALAGAELRPLGDASAWSRRGVSVDISPLVGVTLARWGWVTRPEEEDSDPLNNIW
ncbi:terminase [Streptomyces sp. NPDC006207]